MELFKLNKEIIFITGASGFLGLQYTDFFCKLGSKVFAIDIVKNRKITILEKKYKNLKLNFCNITTESSLKKIKKKIKNNSVPTVLINNAAIDFSPDDKSEYIKPFENFSNDLWSKVMKVNIDGVYLTCKIIGSRMAKKRKGSIINVSSIYGILSPDPKMYENKNLKKKFYKPAAYSVSKSAILNFTKYLSVYWAKKNIRVNNLIIGGMKNKQNKTFIKKYSNRVPIGRMAKVNEYNGPILFLSSDLSSYMTGSSLVVDGGWTAI
jgi:NAD(P)-dependent dehydrogenase (short-subunit alcohol dehydrogenase family)